MAMTGATTDEETSNKMARWVERDMKLLLVSGEN
jgi:hypothetical protein